MTHDEPLDTDPPGAPVRPGAWPTAAWLPASILSALLVTGCASVMPSPSPTRPTTFSAAPTQPDELPSAAPSPAPTRSSPAQESVAATFAVPSIPMPEGCASVGLVETTLQGDQDDPRIAWLVSTHSGRQEVVFPVGYAARFTPALEILDAHGQVVARAGDLVEGACVIGQEAVLVYWP